MNHERALLDLDAFTRVIAPHEHPTFSAPLAVDYAELLIDAGVDGGGSRGLSAHGLDKFAAWLRRDDSLIGRPVHAVAIGRAARDVAVAHDCYAVALVELRRTSAHEIAHAVADRLVDHDFHLDPREYRPWLHDRLRAARPTFGSASSHGPPWWRTFITLVARGETIAPRLLPVDSLAAWCRMYGYGSAGDVRAWIDAAKTDPDYLDLPLVEIPHRNVPALDELLARVPHATPETTSTMAAAKGV